MGRFRLVLGLAAAATVAVCLQGTNEIVASKDYRTDFGSLQLMGVCKATETEGVCWGPNGERNADLEEQFKLAFAAADYRYLPLRPGQKTRVAVFKITNPPYDSSKASIEANFPSQYGGSFDFPYRGTSSMAGEPRVEIRSATIIAKPSDTTAQVSTSIRREHAPSERMPLKEGASLEYLGTTYRIHKIVKTTLDPLVYAQAGSNRWVIAMTAETKEGSYKGSGGWVAIDEAGLVIRAVDKDGNPVVVDPMMLQNMRQQQMVPGRPGTVNTPKIFDAQFAPSYAYNQQRGDDYPIYTNINPAKIKAIYAFGSSSQKLTITDIPLEPKN
jgi:hypothetical protein